MFSAGGTCSAPDIRPPRVVIAIRLQQSEQFLGIKWFVENGVRARLEDLLREFSVRVRLRREANDGNGPSVRPQMSQQLEAAHSGKAQVENQAPDRLPACLS